MHYIKVKGTYLDVGKQIGMTFKKEIKEYVDFRYCQMCNEMQELGYEFSREDYRVFSYELENYIRTYSIDEYQELKGIAQATSQNVSDIIFAIGYTDIFDLIFEKKMIEENLIEHEFNNECSTFVIEKASRKMCGQNWDMDLVSKENACIMRKEYSNGLKICALTTILGLVHMGMNAAGICAGTANLSSKNVSPEGVVFPIVLQNVLKARNRSDALHILSKIKFVSGHYYYIMYPNEPSLLFETDATGYCEIKPQEDIFVHTNHYVNTKLKEHSINYSLNSVERKKAMEIYMQQNNDLSDQQIKQILTNHENGICRHSENKYDIETAASVIFDPIKRQMHVCNNAPCVGKWTTYDMNSIF